MSKTHKVVIIGGGFGGLYAAKRFGGNKSVEVTLVDKRNFHLFQPLLYQVATGGLSPGDISSPLRAVLNRYRNIRVLCDEMIDLNPQRKEVLLKEGTHKYDSLIIATGATHYYFGNPHWEKQAPGLKTLEDALEMRRKLFTAFEEAEKTEDKDVRRAMMTFVIIGAGPTGVELAGALAELAHKTLKDDFRFINPAESKILLLEGGSRILPGYPESLSQKAAARLNKIGVTIFTNALVNEINDVHISYVKDGNKLSIATQTVLWAAGVRASSISELVAGKCGIKLDKSKRIPVNDDLSLNGFPEIFVIGDLASFIGLDGKPLPGVSPVAMQQGRYAARSIIKSLQGKKTEPFRYIDKGSLTVIGRNSAVANISFIRLSGFVAWIIWIFVHIRYLIEFDNKLLVMTQWAWNYFTRKRGARLITHTWNPRF